jgi:hypothetical protein
MSHLRRIASRVFVFTVGSLMVCGVIGSVTPASAATGTADASMSATAAGVAFGPVDGQCC